MRASENPREPATPQDEIVVRRVEAISEFQACQEVQRRAWGITEDDYVVPVATMVAMQRHGGLVLGAFTPDGRLAGFSLAFLARFHGRLGLYSQLTGVDPDFQDRQVGSRLKLAQREAAQAEGLELVAWAFDPLQALNANFNLEKLGATVEEYLVNMYGARTDALSVGLPSDRVLVEWPVAAAPRRRYSAEGLPEAVEVMVRPDGLLEPVGVYTRLLDARVLVEVPERIDVVKKQDPGLARSWQKAVRYAFLSYLERGYHGVGFFRRPPAPGGDNRRCFYVLERRGHED